jgi:hypothetical protein
MGRHARQGPAAAAGAVRSLLRRWGDEEGGARRPAAFLEELHARVPEPGAALGWLAARDADPAIRERAAAVISSTARDPEVSRGVRRPLLKAAGPVLMKAFQDPALSEEHRREIGPLLFVCGIEVPREAYSGAFQDLEGAVDRVAEESLRRLQAGTASVERLLTKGGLIAGDRCPGFDDEKIGAALKLGGVGARLNPPLGASLLCVTAAIAHHHGRSADLLPRALAAAAATRTAEAAWYLSELGRLPGMGPLGSEAGELASRLAEDGVIAAPPPGPDFVAAQVSSVDGVGTRSLGLLFSHGRKPQALSVLLNDVEGIQEIWFEYRWGDLAFGEMIFASPESSCADCDLAFARGLVEEALAIHASSGEPAPGRLLLYRHLLGAEPLVPRRRAPDLSAYGLEAAPLGPELVARSGRLARLPTCRRLGCMSDEAYRFVERLLGGEPADLGALRFTPDVVTEFIETVALEEKDRLLARLAANLETEAMAGRDRRRRNRLLARLYLGILNDVAPFSAVPFVRAVSEKALHEIAHDIGHGWMSREEANRAVLDNDGGCEGHEHDENPF